MLFSCMKLIRNRDNFKSTIRNSKTRAMKILDLRKTHYNHIVCQDTNEICRSYREYLRSKHWKSFKKRFKESSYYRGKCYICERDKNIQYHHITYIRIGKEYLKDIVELCAPCHKNVHRAMRKNPKLTWEIISNKLHNI